MVAAVIERDGKILIAQRRQGSWHALKWEFPGGKVEPGETPDTALIRELTEELGIRATLGGEMVRYKYQYPGRAAILLIFYRVADYTGEPRNIVFEQIRWEHPEQLPAYDFLAGDVEFVGRLARGEL